MDLYKVPGVSETLDWVAALAALDRHELDPAAIDETLGVVLKSTEDLEAVRGRRARGAARKVSPGSRYAGRSRATMSAFLNNLLVFGRLLRGAGLDVHVGSMLDLDRGAAARRPRRRDDVFHTCRALLVHRHEQTRGVRPRLRRVLARPLESVCRSRAATPADRRTRRAPLRQPVGLAQADDRASSPTATTRRRCHATVRTWSDAGALADKDFAEFTPEEMALARVSRSIASRGYPASAARDAGCAGRGPRIDLRRAIARSLRTGGDVITLPRRDGAGCGRVRSCCCATSAGRWSATRACCCTSRTAIGAAAPPLEVFLFSTRADARHRGSFARRRGRRGGRRRVRRGARLVRRHADRRALQQFHQRWSRRVLHDGPVVLLDLGWMGSRRSARAAGTDRPAAAELPSPHLAQPADRHRRTTNRSRADCRPRCRSWTTSCPPGR